MPRARLTIDLDALAQNYATIAGEAGGAEVAPVVKADGYGLGAAALARRLWRQGARRFFVARLEEGEALRDALGDLGAEILVLDGLAADEVQRARQARLTGVINSLEQARRHAGGSAVLHFDTGMNRIGLSVDDAAQVLALGLPVALVMSHLGCAAQPSHARNGRQLARFESVRRLFPDAKASLSASAGIWLGEDYRFDIVRPGISLYGGGPRETPHPDIKAAARLEAPILQIRGLQPGESVGYGEMFVATQPTRIAVLQAGYADGLLRRAAGRAKAWLAGAPAPILAVTMDLIAVDIGAQPGAKIGDMVELLGQSALLDDLARALDTAPHECLTRLSGRAERLYAGGS